jgi:hypothetical protein
MFKHTLRLLALALLVITALLGASLVSAQDEADSANFRLFIGTVDDNPDQFVALSIEEDGSVTIYICDGQVENDTVSVAEWFIGTLTEDTIDITGPSGNRVEATIEEDSVTGQFTFADGSVKTFTLALSEDGTGLFRSEISIEDTDYVLGWISFPDGSIRGAIRNMSTGGLSPASFKKYEQKRDDSMVS